MIKDILTKITAGESLTDDDKAFIATYDPDATQTAVVNAASAAARRKAEAKLAETEQLRLALETKLADKDAATMTESQKWAKQLEDLNKKVVAIEAAKADAEAKATKLVRGQAIGQIKTAKSLAWISGVDHNIVNAAFEAEFSGLDDLSDQVEIDNRVTSFVTKNKALIVDQTGKGSGETAGTPTKKSGGTKTVDKMNDDELLAHMKAKGMLRK